MSIGPAAAALYAARTTPTLESRPSPCPACGATLGALDATCPSCGAALVSERTQVRNPTNEPTGELLDGKWAIERKLGQGGMGTVYLARDVELHRKVAVKMMAAALASNPDVVARFEREARMMARLDHPNLVPVYAVGRKAGVPYIVMKFLEGQALGDRMREKKRLESEEIRSVARQACAALEFVHQRGVVHRDIKPANIFIAPSGHVTVLDLGVARDVQKDMTRTGIIVGTPRYMAPEQIMAKRVDARADIYALATVVFEMATGTPVFAYDSDYSVMKAHIDEPPRDPTTLAPLPAGVGAVLLKALAKRPDDRYATATAFAAALDEAYRAGPEPGLARLPAEPGVIAPLEVKRAPLPPTVEATVLELASVPPTKLLGPEGDEAAPPAAAPVEPPLAPAEVGATRRPPRGLLALGAATVLLVVGGAAVLRSWEPAADTALEAGPATDGTPTTDSPTPAGTPTTLGAPTPAGAPTTNGTPTTTSPTTDSPTPAGTPTTLGAPTPAGTPTAGGPSTTPEAPGERGSQLEHAPQATGETEETADEDPSGNPVRGGARDAARPAVMNVVTSAGGMMAPAYVDVDGIRRGSTPLKLTLEPGKHMLVFHRQGFAPFRHEVAVTPGQMGKIKVELPH